MTLEERMARADEARRLLEKDSLLRQVLNALANEYVADWKVSRDQATREDLYHRHRALAEVATSIEALMRDGQMAERESERNSRMERINA